MCAEQKPIPEPLTLEPNNFFMFLQAVRKVRCELSVDEALALAWRTWNNYSEFQRDAFMTTREFDSVCPLADKYKPRSKKPPHTTTRRRRK